MLLVQKCGIFGYNETILILIVINAILLRRLTQIPSNPQDTITIFLLCLKKYLNLDGFEKFCNPPYA
ncbi:uncharacterized protein METZ01_LOCUS92449 [marine metagenome]|uniref:Uncharacterized protein n=1 Tax=marine metagenome TaxID=408172 RepID=A0A381VGW6_9ZZZZ